MSTQDGDTGTFAVNTDVSAIPIDYHPRLRPAETMKNLELGIILSLRQGSRRPVEHLKNFDFADAIVLVSHTTAKVQNLIQ